jgi:Flp pilus assembly protein TadB
MAQTKRKRRTKHRGTAAGTIESRGRTGRPPSAEERKKQDRMTAREKRLNTPPTWRSALTRAGIAAVIVFIFILLTAKGKDKLTTALAFTFVALVIYIPAGYYLELTLYRRRQRKNLAQGGGSKKR